MGNTCIAVVDDDAVSREVVAAYLADAGYSVRAFDGPAAFRSGLDGVAPDLVLLDLRMPGEDGLSLLRWLRQGSELPVIMLTSADDTTDRVVGLEMGADDYVPKSGDLRELLARIRSVLRRRPATPAAVPLLPHAPKLPEAALRGEHWFGRWRLDRSRRRLVDSGGEVCPITGAEFALLSAFADHPRVVLSRERLLELSGTDPAEVFDRAVDLRVTRLRRKIEPVPGDPTVIRTVRGHGGGYEYLPSEGPDYGR
ncbi:response regulator [Solimonas sp. K1W22B-7]|uniref:response regulator n=1 Tax=Solimonas sp. K1W22B-7 TaxID=2303331 RepID=UPI000E330EE7|nr:response regulator [Solimonas sp. K1W22B-7]AXQ29452.1 response regulator [Solimonas sp. K1W22B-7]